MSKHIIEWLNAYLDGELKGSQLRQVEAHLAECQTCRDEVESLARVSSLLREVPAPEFTSSERFAARVNLRLPHRPVAIPKNRIAEIGWWMIPVGLLGTWFFVSASLWVSGLLSVANNLGLASGLSNWLALNTGSESSWSATLGQIGVLSGSNLNWAATLEVLTRTSLPQMILNVSIALLYLSWMVVWWARRQQQEHGQLLKG